MGNVNKQANGKHTGTKINEGIRRDLSSREKTSHPPGEVINGPFRQSLGVTRWGTRPKQPTNNSPVIIIILQLTNNPPKLAFIPPLSL